MCMHESGQLHALRAPPGALTSHGGQKCAIGAPTRWSQALLGTLWELQPRYAARPNPKADAKVGHNSMGTAPLTLWWAAERAWMARCLQLKLFSLCLEHLKG